MAMTCVTGGKECTGCMACQYADYICDDTRNAEDYGENIFYSTCDSFGILADLGGDYGE